MAAATRVGTARTGGVVPERSPLPTTRAVVAVAVGIVATAAILVTALGVVGPRDPVGPVEQQMREDPAPVLVGWIEGLTTGTVLPSDVTSRVGADDPGAATAILDASSLLDDLGPDGARIATRWLDGLAAGTLLTTDVQAHLVPIAPRIADTVAEVWWRVGGAPGAAASAQQAWDEDKLAAMVGRQAAERLRGGSMQWDAGMLDAMRGRQLAERVASAISLWDPAKLAAMQGRGLAEGAATDADHVT